MDSYGDYLFAIKMDIYQELSEYRLFLISFALSIVVGCYEKSFGGKLRNSLNIN